MDGSFVENKSIRERTFVEGCCQIKIGFHLWCRASWNCFGFLYVYCERPN